MTDSTEPTAAKPSKRQPMDRDGFIRMVADAERLIDTVNKSLAEAAPGITLATLNGLRRVAAAEAPAAEGEGKPRKGRIAKAQQRALSRSNLISAGDDGQVRLTDKGRGALAAGEAALDRLVASLAGGQRPISVTAGRPLGRAAKALGRRKGKKAGAEAEAASAV